MTARPARSRSTPRDPQWRIILESIGLTLLAAISGWLVQLIQLIDPWGDDEMARARYLGTTSFWRRRLHNVLSLATALFFVAPWWALSIVGEATKADQHLRALALAGWLLGMAIWLAIVFSFIARDCLRAGRKPFGYLITSTP